MRRYWHYGLVLLALTPSAWFAWRYRDVPQLGQYHDDTIYWVTARSLAQGHGYRIASLPEQPVQTKYPPLYPLLLAAVWKLHSSFPANQTTALWLQWLFLPCFVWLGRKMLLDLGVEPNWSWPLAAWMALSTVMVLLSLSFMSDLPFCLALFGSLLLVSRAARPGAPARLAVLAGLLAGVAYLTRTAALPLLATAPLWLAWRRRFSRAVLFAAAASPAVLWWTFWVRTHLQPSTDFTTIYYLDYVGYQRYSVPWDSLFVVVKANIGCLLFSISQLLTSQMRETTLGNFFWRMFCFAAVAGCWRLVRRASLGPYPIYAILSVLLILVCGWPTDSRQVAPLLPLFLAGLGTEVAHLAGMVRRSLTAPVRSTRISAGVIGAALTVWCGAAVYSTGQALFGSLPEVLAQHRTLHGYRRDAYRWIAANVPPDATFVAYDDVLLYLYTGRPGWSIRLPFLLYFQGETEAFVAGYTAVREFAEQHGATYLLTTNGDYSRAEVPVSHRAAVHKTIAEKFASERVYSGPGASVYRLSNGSGQAQALRHSAISVSEMAPSRMTRQ